MWRADEVRRGQTIRVREALTGRQIASPGSQLVRGAKGRVG